jgi:chromosome segregation ATPase
MSPPTFYFRLGRMESLDPSLVVTALGMLVSVVAAAAIVKQRLQAVIEQMMDIEKRIRSLDTRVDTSEVHRSTIEQRVSILSTMLSPERRQVLHERLATLEATMSTHRREIDNHRAEYLSAHNGRHPPVPAPEAIIKED